MKTDKDEATQADRMAALEAENARLRDAVADKVSAATMLTGMTTGPDGLRLALQGGAASLLAEMLAQQFKDGGGINYLELSFVSRKAAPGDAFVVTVQRVLGKTPHALRTEAEAKHAALEAALRDMLNTLTDGPDESDVARVFAVARKVLRDEVAA